MTGVTRTFSLLTLAGLVLAAGANPQQPPNQKPPDQEPAAQQEQRPAPIRPAHLVLLNGKVFTLEPPPPPEEQEAGEDPEIKVRRRAQPTKKEAEEQELWVTEVVALRGERILAVGTTEEIEKYVRPGFTQVINLRGRLVLPGFIDNHTHFAQAGHLLLGLNLLDVAEPGEFRRRVKEASDRLPPDAWLVGGDWGAYEQWEKNSTGEQKQEAEPPAAPPPAEEEEPTEEEPQEEQEPPAPVSQPVPPQPEWPPLRGFLPSKELIDPVTGDRPALISRFDQQVFLANSAALRAAGIDAATPDPREGLIVRNAEGEPTGLLRGAAVNLVRDVIPPLGTEQRRAEALRALDELRRYGVTSFHDNVGDLETLEMYQQLQREEKLTARVWARLRLSAWEPLLEYIRLYRIPRANGGWGDQFIRLGGLKGWVDGIMGNSTALFFEPYNHQPESRGQLRDIMFPEGNLYNLIKGADQAGFTVTVHAIGDRANRILLDTYERVFKENPPRDRRFRVVHAQVVHPDDFKRFGELGLVAEVQPYHAIDDMRWMEERIGDRAQYAYAFKTLEESGAVMSFGTDWPGTNASYYPVNPLLGLYAAVTRQTLKGEPTGGWHPEQKIELQDALRYYTLNNAYAAFEEGVKGSIKVGKLGDLVVLDRDILARPPEELKDTRVDYTILGGTIIFDRVQEERDAGKKAESPTPQI